jgi:hypothetical protein
MRSFDGRLDNAERLLNSGSHRRAYRAFEDCSYNPNMVTGGSAAILARGRAMRARVTGSGWEGKWDRLLTRLEVVHAEEDASQQPPVEPATMPGEDEQADLNPAAALLRLRHSTANPTPSPAPSKAESVASPMLDAATKLCPDCAEDVRAQARKCRYCGYEFSKTCPECAEDVRAQARKCRHCGYRFASEAGEADTAEVA